MTINELITELGRYAKEYPLGGDAPIVIKSTAYGYEEYSDFDTYQDKDGNIVIYEL